MPLGTEQHEVTCSQFEVIFTKVAITYERDMLGTEQVPNSAIFQAVNITRITALTDGTRAFALSELQLHLLSNEREVGSSQPDKGIFEIELGSSARRHTVIRDREITELTTSVIE